MKTAADVVIVGGGCMGCSVAWHLAQRGITNVVLIEREPQLATGSTGKNAGGVRHQFSHSANIEMSIESIAMIANFEAIVGTPIDFHQDGYLFLLSRTADVAAFLKNVELQKAHGVDVRWLSPKEAAALAPGLDVTGVKGATYCPADGVADPNGVTMGFAKGAQARGVEIVRETEVNGIRLDGNRVAEVRTSRGNIATPGRRQRRRAVGEVDRPPARRGRAGRARAPAHLHRVAAGRRVMGRPGQRRQGAALEVAGDRLRDHLLLSSRGWRAAVRDGRPGRAAGVRHHRAMGFPAQGHRRRDAAPARDRRRRGVARVGGPLRDDARSQPDHRAVERCRRVLHHRRLQRPRLPARAGRRPHPRGS